MEDRVKTKNYKLILPQNDEFYDVEDFNKNAEAIDELISNINNVIGYTNSIYGVELDFENKKIKRLAGAVDADFDSIPIFARRRCVLDDNGNVIVYEGEDGYTESGTVQITTVDDMGISVTGTYKGQVMVEDVPFYYRVIPQKLERNENGSVVIRKMSIFVSENKYDGFKLHPYFKSETKCNYRAAFSASKQIETGVVNLHTANIIGDKLASVLSEETLLSTTTTFYNGSDDEYTGTAVNAFLKLASNRGPGWTLLSDFAVEATQILYLIENAKFEMDSDYYRGEQFDDNYFCTSGIMKLIRNIDDGYISAYEFESGYAITDREASDSNVSTQSDGGGMLLMAMGGGSTSNNDDFIGTKSVSNDYLFSFIAETNEERTITDATVHTVTKVELNSGSNFITTNVHIPLRSKDLFSLCFLPSNKKFQEIEKYAYTARIMYCPDTEDNVNDCITLDYGTDLNMLTDTFKYSLYGAIGSSKYKNSPSREAGLLEVIEDSEHNILQRYTSYSSKEVYVRTYAISEWTDWVCINPAKETVFKIQLPTDFSRDSEYKPYTASVEIMDITSNDIVEVFPQWTEFADDMRYTDEELQAIKATREAEKEAWDCISYIRTTDGTIVFECDDDVPQQTVALVVVVVGTNSSEANLEILN